MILTDVEGVMVLSDCFDMHELRPSLLKTMAGSIDGC